METEQITVKDNLHLLDDPEVVKLFNGEKLLFSDKITKINRFGFSQERWIAITDKGIYNFKKKCKLNENDFFIKKYSFKTSFTNRYNFRSNNK